MVSSTAIPWIEPLPSPILLVALDDARHVQANQRARARLGLAGGPCFAATALFAEDHEPGHLLKALRHAGHTGPGQMLLKNGDGSRAWFPFEAQQTEAAGRAYALIALGEPHEAHKPAPHGVPWQAAFDKAGVGIVLMDAECRFLNANQHWLDMFGYRAEELRALRHHDLPQYRDPFRFEDRMAALLRGEIEQYRAEKCYVSKAGLPFWGDLSVSALRDPQGGPLLIIGFLLDITARKRAEEQLHEANDLLEMRLLENLELQEQLSELAVRDALTGIFNRRYMEETLRRELSRTARECIPLSVVLMDIDHFKQLNDAHGHLAGDEMLKAMAGMLTRQMRSEDVACRYGGEEFVAILPGAPLEVAAQRAESWRAAFAALAVKHGENVLSGTLSLGVSEFPRHGTSADELLAQADGALYLAKRSGRNRVMV